MVESARVGVAQGSETCRAVRVAKQRAVTPAVAGWDVVPGRNRVDRDDLQPRPPNHLSQALGSEVGDMKLDRLYRGPSIGPALCHRAGDIRNLQREQAIIAEQCAEMPEQIDRVRDVLEDVKHADQIELVSRKLDLIQETALNLGAELRYGPCRQLG